MFSNSPSFYKHVNDEQFDIKSCADDDQLCSLFTDAYQYNYFILVPPKYIFKSVIAWIPKSLFKFNLLHVECQTVVFYPEAITHDVYINRCLLENCCIYFCNTVKNLGFYLTLNKHSTI